MTPRLVFAYVVMTVLISGVVFSDDTPQKQGEVLLDRARQLSDIRQPNSPAFRLKATFSFVGEDLETSEGTYTELWVSDSRWRREIVVGNLRRTEVGVANRIWILDSSKGLPEQVLRIPNVMSVLPAKSAKFEFESVTGTSPQDTTTICAITKPSGPKKEKHAFCFDRKAGVLVESITPQRIRERVADYSCQYNTFKKFGDQWFPRDVDCVLNGHRQMELKVVELSNEMPTDATLFAAPSGAIEIGKCTSGAVPPKPVSTPNPSIPPWDRDHGSTVSLRIIVDVMGKTQDAIVTHSGGKHFDDLAVGTVRRWRFKPGTCNGDAMPMQINVDFNFQIYR